jgi:multicomponent Na+:H+ antiporter subunit D
MSELAHPAWPYLVGAALVAIAPGPVRQAALLLVPAIALALSWVLPDGAHATVHLLGVPLVLLKVDGLSRVFALIFALVGGLGALYSAGSGSRRLHTAAFTCTAAALGIALAGDWVTFYAWWELLSIAGFAVVTDGATRRATAAAYRYLLVHLIGGGLLLAGLAVHAAEGGPVEVGPLPVAGAGALILLAFALNAAVPPLHAWLPDAYPESSTGGSVFLSAFATKAAVYALARVFPGLEPLVWAGAGMAVYGVVYALTANDMRRLLSYHIVSQVGFMVAGIGMGTPLALAGAVAHAFCHILYKALLLMSAGAVQETTGRRRLSDLGGLRSSLSVVLLLYMVGALAISGAPLLNGFVSKSMIIAAAEDDHREIVALLLTLASVGTFLSVGLKLPVTVFGGPLRAPIVRPLSPAALAAMVLTALLCLGLGVHPGMLYALLPYSFTYDPYTTGHVLDALQLLGGAALGFALARRWLGPKPTVTLDVDQIYRRLGALVGRELAPAVARLADGAEALAACLVDGRAPGQARPRVLPVGYAVAATVIGLAAALVFLR